MFNVRTTLRQTLLALMLAGSSLLAAAAPVSYHVDLNTSSLSGDGLVSLEFMGSEFAPNVVATLSNFTGAFGAPGYTEGAVKFYPDGTLGIANGPDFVNLVDINALFGGVLGFDIAFSDDLSGDTGEVGSTFTVALYDLAFNSRGLARFELIPGMGIVPGPVDQIFAIGPVVAEVPEPSELLLMMTGLGLMGVVARRRKAKAVS